MFITKAWALTAGLSFWPFVFIYLKDSILKMIKNAFYFMLRPIFVLEIFRFLFQRLGYVVKWLDKKAGQSIEHNVGNIFLEKSCT